MTAPFDLNAIRERARDTALQRSGPLGDAQDFMDGADAASDVWQAEVERLRAESVPRSALVPVGFHHDEGLTPVPDQSCCEPVYVIREDTDA